MSSVDIPSLNATFLHIPKTAGRSVSEALMAAAADATILPTRDMVVPTGAAQYLMSRTDPGLLARRWSFCFIRNPWDWTVSGWLHVTRNRPAYGDAPPDFADFVRNPWTRSLASNPHPQKYADARTFVAHHCRISQSEHLAADTIGTPAPMAFYGRFETLAEDWDRICNRLGLDMPLSHANRSDRADYTTYYTDALRNVVKARNRPLIERFGYRFGA